MNTITDQLDRKNSGVHDISPQLYQRVPDAGSRGNVTLSLIAASRYLRPNMKVSKQFFSALEQQWYQPWKHCRRRCDAWSWREFRQRGTSNNFLILLDTRQMLLRRENWRTAHERITPHRGMVTENVELQLSIFKVLGKSNRKYAQSSHCYVSFQGWFLSFILQKSVAPSWKNSSIIWGKWWRV